jgi:hypothetical protein
MASATSCIFCIARIAGIDVKIHATFLLIVILGAMQWSALGLPGMAFGALLMLALFLVSLLHEFGHAFACRLQIAWHDHDLGPGPGSGVEHIDLAGIFRRGRRITVAGEILGKKVHRDLSDVPDDISLTIIAVDAKKAVEAGKALCPEAFSCAHNTLKRIFGNRRRWSSP